MCGITGVLDLARTRDNAALETIVHGMAATLHHRGPDDTGTWVDQENGIALGHKRLSILDLSPFGHQPMHSASGRYCVSYNGEVYNHGELRQELERFGRSFRGRSDTEVLVEAIDCWGIPETLSRSNGMFALAVWDARQHRLTLARDRIGIKPLYYGWFGDTFIFGSELKALRAHPHFRGEVDRNAIAMLLRHCYIPAPYSIYRGVKKLPPGTTLEINVETARHASTPVPFWEMTEVARRGCVQPFEGSSEIAVDELERLLQDSVRLRMEADVPLGAFLSGGIDSSLVVALMQSQNTRPVRTFSIGFHEAAYNEANYAKAVAKHLGTEHTEYYVTPEEAIDVIPSLPEMYDEPFADSSQIPTYLVSKITKQHVTVSLSGDGGDELFGGYNRYAHTEHIWNKVARLPRGLRSLAASLLQLCVPWRGEEVRRLLRTPHAQALYAWLNTHWKEPDQIVVGAQSRSTIFDRFDQWNTRPNFVEQMMHLDAVTYLPDDILTKVDRASMAVSLEARVPLLDYRVVEFAWSLPFGLKVHHGQAKYPLRQVLRRRVPDELFERPKVGFGVPINEWLRGPLRDWAEALLSEDRLKQEGFFDAERIRLRWQDHLQGTAEWHYWLWDVLMFQAWLENNR
ncbi:MAG: asparagine synthase (glutamine-hydrolyzing) [Planctomycetes bacterium]|nr:asparagine synthase (glutamine-hydrolyzing) [Planctomycetota bacterium]